MQITVLASPAIAPALPLLACTFERASGHAVALAYATAGEMRNALTGSGIDVAISTAEVIDELQVQGRLYTSGRRDIARVGLGVQTQRGAPGADVSTTEGLRCALLAARSIGYADPASGAAAGAHAARLLAQLGIAQAVAGKTKLLAGRALRDAVANGEVELGLAPVSEILADSSVDLVGHVPPPLQEVTVLSAARAIGGGDAAQAFVDFLANPASRKELETRGLA